MSPDLPLKIRADIRDLWDSPKASLHSCVESVAETLGVECITPQAQWVPLWDELQDKFPDKSVFVPTVVRYTIAWYERLHERLEDETWVEALLVSLETVKGGLRLQIEPCTINSVRPFTRWSKNLGSFYLGIPKAEPVSQPQLVSAFDKDLDSLFNQEKVDEEVYLEMEAQPKAAVISTVQAKQRLPVIDALGRPNNLFKVTVPYILTVALYGKDSIRVDCSYEGSPECLHGYLQKWAKTSPTDSQRRPIFKVELVESDFFVGVIDSLTIVPTMNYYKSLNPTIILAFVEGVLGYTMMHTTGSTWMYRSTSIFK